MKSLLLTLLFLLPIPSPLAQEKGTVYVYMPTHKKMLTRIAPSIYCDDVKIAEIPGGRYFKVRLEPGSHTFRSKDKKRGGVEIEVKSGETYYLRVKLDADGYFLRFDGIELVPPENGRFDVKQMKPLSSKDAKSSLVEFDER